MYDEKSKPIEHLSIKEKAVSYAIKAFEVDFLIFIYSPSLIALACVDLAVKHVSNP